MLQQSSPLGIVAVLALYAVLAVMVASSRLPKSVRTLCVLAIGLRIVGSLARYWMITEYYGRGDALEYFLYGRYYADLLWAGDIEGFLDSSSWRGGRWWGTQFTQYFSGVVVAMLGPTIIGGFFFFALLSFIGLSGFAIAFRNAYPHVPIRRYLLWIWFFPSLWFWPASIGKEALTLLGMGLATAGFVWKNSRMNWPLMGLGVLLVFAVRPHTAAAIILAMVIAQWVGATERWTPRRTAQGVMILAAGMTVMYFALRSLGVESMDVEGIQGYVETLPGRRIDTGTNVEVGAVGITGVPIALMNILLRPFPFEVGNVANLMASVEIWSLWLFMFIARRRVWDSLKHWRHNHLLRYALAFAAIYTVMLGMSTGNLGILARQRIFLFPMLLILLAAAHRRSETTPVRSDRRPVPRPYIPQPRTVP